MKTNYFYRHLTYSILLAIGLSLGMPTAAVATPANEISRAVSAGGASDVKHATPEQFIRAFTAVTARVKEKQVSSYVSAAVAMRPELAPQIVVAAINVARPIRDKQVVDKQIAEPCEWIDPIIRAAIAAAPNEKDAIVRAAIAADPWAKECILAAAGIKEIELVMDVGNITSTTFGTINPANIVGGVQSPSQP